MRQGKRIEIGFGTRIRIKTDPEQGCVQHNLAINLGRDAFNLA